MTKYSGKFVVRVSPGLHREIVEAAKKKHFSLNGFINSVLEQATKNSLKNSKEKVA